MKVSRRDVLGASLAMSAGVGIAQSARAQSFRRIATEEIFCPPKIVEASRRAIMSNPDLEPGWAGSFNEDNPRLMDILERIQEVAELRIQAMDEGRIDFAVLSMWSPGVQIFDAAEGTELAALANESMAEVVQSMPDRFAGLATIAPQDPKAAALEVERAVKSLGMKGVLINSHTHNEYLDDRKFWPILEACVANKAPIYLHPRVPSTLLYDAMPYEYNMHSAKWGFAMDTSTHIVRMISAAVFDDFPDLQLVVGHMGEGLPFWLHRLDTVAGRFEVGNRIKKHPSEYIRENTVITTSGMSWDPILKMSIEAMGPENVLFATDYPYGNYAADTAWMDAVDIPDDHKRLIYGGNAERVFSL